VLKTHSELGDMVFIDINLQSRVLLCGSAQRRDTTAS